MLSELVVPVIVGTEVAGVLNVESQRLEAFNDEDQKLLETLASYVASAIIRLKHNDAPGIYFLASHDVGVDRRWNSCC